MPPTGRPARRAALSRSTGRARADSGQVDQLDQLAGWDAHELTGGQIDQLAGGQINQLAGVARARELLAAVGLGERETALPATLSGEQQQRVAIARATGP